MKLEYLRRFNNAIHRDNFPIIVGGICVVFIQPLVWLFDVAVGTVHKLIGKEQ
jgi:hypothetical protein